MEDQTLRARVLRGDLTFGTFLNLGSPVAAELCARAGFDWVVIDQEHGSGTDGDLLAMLYALGGTSTTPLVRPQSGERLRIGRALDLGAAGIMVPRLDTIGDIREALSYLRYPPGGIRGVALLTRGAGFGAVAHADVHALNARILGIFQVESPRAVQSAREIAGLDGVDVLFVGPTDLSHSMGIAGQFDHPDFIDAVGAVAAAARAHGKAAGILLQRLEDVPRHVDAGYRFVAVGSDVAFVANGARAVTAYRKAMVEASSNPTG